MPLFKGFKFSFNLSSQNNTLPDLYENVSPVYVTGAYKVTGEQFYGASSIPEAHKKITPSMVKLPAPFQPDPTDPDVIRNSQSTGDLTNIQTPNIPPKLRKSTPEISTDPQGSSTQNRQSTDLRNKTKTKVKSNKEQQKFEKKRLEEQKKQEKLEAQKRAKEEKLQKEREKAESKEKAQQEKLKMQKEKADAAKAKKEKVVVKGRSNPLAQGPNAPLPYATNTLESSISKTSGPPPYEDKPVTNKISTNKDVVKNESDNTGNTSFGAPIESSSTWDMVEQHRVQINRAPAGSAANKIAIRLQEDPNTTAVTGRKSLYV